ncbi:hypothetical protein NDU88_006997 [Pleurodeles waltl]|uniref:Uncharacterized protein n=1 Tax=Pleurodeles waltl TaxID=8319 RepID=A0AAV7RTH9_PLEWA|nr:hypothetical protein NDU88_006997 [Pleurodeles waltl]
MNSRRMDERRQASCDFGREQISPVCARESCGGFRLPAFELWSPRRPDCQEGFWRGRGFPRVIVHLVREPAFGNRSTRSALWGSPGAVPAEPARSGKGGDIICLAAWGESGAFILLVVAWL